ncbi:MAG: thiamine phosphate synthase [Syntrophomonadaceae bacterium]|nr:thiamine phosphate synthase [Syntrophomonadaceae bacterium]
MSVDYSLYLITDRYLIGSKDFYTSVRRALEGGVTLLQVREKDAASQEFFDIGLKLKEIAAEFNVPLIVNDRVDIALAIDADGVHVGSGDLPLEVVRRLLGPRKILGYSVSNPQEARYGERNGADYLGAGPVYSTGSKKDASNPIGVEALRTIKQSVNIPVVAIGGINASNLNEVKSTGVDGISVISAILSRDDTFAAARELVELWRK